MALPKSIEALQSIKVELESRSKGMKQVFDSAGSKFRVDFKAGFAQVEYSKLAIVKANSKFGYSFKISARGRKAVEAIELAIAQLKQAEQAAAAKAKKDADDAVKKAAAEKK